MLTGKKKVAIFIVCLIVLTYFMIQRKILRIATERYTQKKISEEEYHDIWICSHNMQSYPIDSELSLCEGAQAFVFKLCQEVGLARTIASIGRAKWLSISRLFPNRWMTYGNARHRSGNSSIIHSMALGINVNSGFIPNSYTVMPVRGVERKCILVVHGAFYGSRLNFTIANFHGDWNGHYNNKNNILTITWFLKYMKKYLSQNSGHFVLAGDFNIDYDTLKSIRSDLDAIIPDLIYPTLEHQIVTYIENQLFSLDHIISNIEVRDLVTRPSPLKSDHMLLSFKVRLPYVVKPHSIGNVQQLLYRQPNY